MRKSWRKCRWQNRCRISRFPNAPLRRRQERRIYDLFSLWHISERTEVFFFHMVIPGMMHDVARGLHFHVLSSIVETTSFVRIVFGKSISGLLEIRNYAEEPW